MKRYNIFYFIWEALKSLYRNGVMTFASIAVLLSCLIVIGGFSLIVVNFDYNLENLGNLNEIVFFCKTDASEEEILRIEKTIKSLDNVKEVTRNTKAEQLADLKEDNSAYADISEEENPLSDAFTIKYYDNKTVQDLVHHLEQIPGKDYVRNNVSVANNVESIKNTIMLIFVWFLVILFVVSVFIIINTIKLTVYSRRKEISIMRYIGATNWFITLPFLCEGAIIGLVSGALSFFVMKFGYSALLTSFGEVFKMISFINFSEVDGIMVLLTIGIGTVTGILGSTVSLRKYLTE